jgi:hypothetical protein
LERALLGDASLEDDSFLEQLENHQTRDAWRKACTYSDLETLFVSLSNELMKGKEDSPFYNLAARSCALPGAFIGCAFLIQQYLGKPNAYTAVIRANILGAGDTCSRAIFLGAVLSAAAVATTTDDTNNDAEHFIPEEWWQKINPNTEQRIHAAAKMIANLSQPGE